jgi:hypothetical protein
MVPDFVSEGEQARLKGVIDAISAPLNAAYLRFHHCCCFPVPPDSCANPTFASVKPESGYQQPESRQSELHKQRHVCEPQRGDSEKTGELF